MNHMAKLIYAMFVSLDGYAEDADGKFGWGFPENEEMFSYINDLYESCGTYLYGRRMYETMLFWETADQHPELPPVALAYARQWKAARKIVYSKTLDRPRSKNTHIEREFDADAVRRLMVQEKDDITVDGPGLAHQALLAGVVDEIHVLQCPILVGGGKRFFPEGVRMNVDLLDEKRFPSGVIILRYAVR